MNHSAPLHTVLNALHHQDNLAVFDVGHQWTVVTWAHAPEIVCGHEEWIAHARALQQKQPASHLPFQSGLVGWIGYEAGQYVEQMPAGTVNDGQTNLRLWHCPGAICIHHPSRTVHLTGSKVFQDEAQTVLHAASPAPAPLRPTPWTVDRAERAEHYQAGVCAIQRSIAAGDVYQVNLAWQASMTLHRDPIHIWLSLREANPATRGAFLRSKNTTILSNSPELYLSVTPQGHLQSVPIKGTAKHSDGDAGRMHLWSSEKERAELTMIVDLVRNDLGRVARVGSVHATPRTLRRCGDLLHAEQAVTAQLRPDLDVFDAIEASFPPGSVTGAPKVSAMKSIHRLEQQPRGVYTGALGYVCDSGAAHFNVAIRTAVITDQTAAFHIGAGIVADSDPHREYNETCAKGQALAGWLGAR